MLRSSIPGLDRVLGAEPSPPYITLVTGPPGAMKSTLCLTAIGNHLRQTGRFGLYCTVEESVESLLRSTESLGMVLPSNMQITDFTELRNDNADMDYLKFTQRMVEHFKSEQGENFTTFVLDSLGAIYSLTDVNSDMRKRMFAFFAFLRRMNLNTMIITERHIGDRAELKGNEGFLADGILSMGIDRRGGRLVRTLQVEKMRHIAHSMDKMSVEPSPQGLTVMGPIFD